MTNMEPALFDIILDPDLPLPRNPEPRHDQTRNHRFAFRPLDSQLYQHVFVTSPASFDP